MKRTVQYAEARRILRKVPNTDMFWLCTNENLKSLSELALSLEKVNDDIFRYHVNRDKNDFEVWIREVIKDKELAREIARVKTKETLIRKINERVSSIKRIVKLHRTLLEKKRAKKSKTKKKAKRTQKKRKVKKASKKRKTAKRKAKKAVRKAKHKKRTKISRKRRR
ncbi:hypothetical protein CMO88_03750 [Candidatus Woesearchaeota archaeon]|nr:hypothetical protein [Candidatus Woesearchaeota archaeon]|tara:strand:- start:14734 stop:15234 length:501 start_codon:yes stop_codon:yes gene_type:complete